MRHGTIVSLTPCNPLITPSQICIVASPHIKPTPHIRCHNAVTLQSPKLTSLNALTTKCKGPIMLQYNVNQKYHKQTYYRTIPEDIPVLFILSSIVTSYTVFYSSWQWGNYSDATLSANGPFTII